MTMSEQDCNNVGQHKAYNCATCNAVVCDGCEHEHRDYWANEEN